MFICVPQSPFFIFSQPFFSLIIIFHNWQWWLYRCFRTICWYHLGNIAGMVGHFVILNNMSLDFGGFNKIVLLQIVRYSCCWLIFRIIKFRREWIVHESCLFNQISVTCIQSSSLAFEFCTCWHSAEFIIHYTASAQRTKPTRSKYFLCHDCWFMIVFCRSDCSHHTGKLFRVFIMKHCDRFFYRQFFRFVYCCHPDRFLFLSVFLDQLLWEICPAYQFFLIRAGIEDDPFLASLIVQVSVSDTYCSVQGAEHVCGHIQVWFPNIGLYVFP